MSSFPEGSGSFPCGRTTHPRISSPAYPVNRRSSTDNARTGPSTGVSVAGRAAARASARVSVQKASSPSGSASSGRYSRSNSSGMSVKV